MDKRNSSYAIGRRTRVNVLAGKTVRKHKDGGDVFEDYWTDSSEENSNFSAKSSPFFDLSVKSRKELSELSYAHQTEDISETNRKTPKSRRKLSKSAIITNSPLSSSKKFHINKISLSERNLQKSVTCNLDEEVEISHHAESVNKNDKEELNLSSVTVKMNNSRRAKSFGEVQRRRSSREDKSILSRYDEYDSVIMQLIQDNNEADTSEHAIKSILSEHNRSKSNFNSDNLSSSSPSHNNDDDSLSNSADDEIVNSEQPISVNIENQNDKSMVINSHECSSSQNSHKDKVSSSFHISPINKENVKLNSPTKFRKNSNENIREISQIMLNVSNSSQETLKDVSNFSFRSENSSRHIKKNAIKSKVKNKSQKITVDTMNRTSEYEFNDHELEKLPVSDIASKGKKHYSIPKVSSASISVTERNAANKDNTPNKQNSSKISTQQEILPENSNLHNNSLLEGHNFDKSKDSTKFKKTEKRNSNNKRKISQTNTSTQHRKSNSVMDFPAEKEQHAFTSEDNHLLSRSKRKHLPEPSNIESEFHNRKSKSFSVNSKSQKLNVSVNEPLNISVNNIQSSSNSREKEKSLKYKSKKKYNEKQVRRSSRMRYPVLERWRNERLLYCYKNKEIKVLGVDKGFDNEDIFLKGKKIPSKEKVPKVKKIKFYDNKSQKNVRIILHKTYNCVAWELNKNNAYRIKRVFETLSSAFGYIEINPFEKKPSQQMPEEDLQLTVIEGNVEIKVQGNIIKAEKRDMIIIPRCTAYSIINNNKRRALLTYCVGKFKFLEQSY